MEKLIVSQLVSDNQVQDGVSKDSCVIRVSKYDKSDGAFFFRISSTIDSQCIDYLDDIENIDMAQKEFEKLQIKHFGTIKQKFKFDEFN